MDALNSAGSRKSAPAANMRVLEQACLEADARIRMRRVAATNAQMFLVVGFGVPFCSYLIYNFFAANGVMQNYKTSSGAYMNYAMTWMLKPKLATPVYRPEIDIARQAGPLVAYTRKIEAQRADGTLPEGVHHPTHWH